MNKTNQFNTTGKRWVPEEISRELAAGLRMVTFFVEDRFTEYGLVGLVLVRDDWIIQFVMSCRVLGLDIERAVVMHVLTLIKRAGRQVAYADLVETAANLPCRQLYQENSFTKSAGSWSLRLDGVELTFPRHIDVGTQEASGPV